MKPITITLSANQARILAASLKRDIEHMEDILKPYRDADWPQTLLENRLEALQEARAQLWLGLLDQTSRCDNCEQIDCRNIECKGSVTS